jgi:hypothetical protein
MGIEMRRGFDASVGCVVVEVWGLGAVYLSS